MPNKERRKLNKRAINSYIKPGKRVDNKLEDGKPVRPLTAEERRYVAQVNRFNKTAYTGSYAFARDDTKVVVNL